MARYGNKEELDNFNVTDEEMAAFKLLDATNVIVE